MCGQSAVAVRRKREVGNCNVSVCRVAPRRACAGRDLHRSPHDPIAVFRSRGARSAPAPRTIRGRVESGCGSRKTFALSSFLSFPLSSANSRCTLLAHNKNKRNNDTYAPKRRGRTDPAPHGSKQNAQKPAKAPLWSPCWQIPMTDMDPREEAIPGVARCRRARSRSGSPFCPLAPCRAPPTPKERSQTSSTALMQPSFSGLLVTWAYFPHTTLPAGVTSPRSEQLTSMTVPFVMTPSEV